MATGKHSNLTEKVIQAFYQVYNTLGYGFSEKVYQNSLVLELTKAVRQLLDEHEAQLLNERQGSLAWTKSN